MSVIALHVPKSASLLIMQTSKYNSIEVVYSRTYIVGCKACELHGLFLYSFMDEHKLKELASPGFMPSDQVQWNLS